MRLTSCMVYDTYIKSLPLISIIINFAVIFNGIILKMSKKDYLIKIIRELASVTSWEYWLRIQYNVTNRFYVFWNYYYLFYFLNIYLLCILAFCLVTYIELYYLFSEAVHLHPVYIYNPVKLEGKNFWLWKNWYRTLIHIQMRTFDIVFVLKVSSDFQFYANYSEVD